MSPRPDKGNRAPFLSQTWEGSSLASVWWPGPAGQARIQRARPVQPRNDNMEPPPCGLTTCKESHGGRVHCKLGSRQRRGPGRADTWHRRLVLGTWNVTSGKEPELVREVERFQLDMVGFTSTHSTGSGTKLLERGWTLSFSGVAQGVRCQAGVGILPSPRLSAAVLQFLPPCDCKSLGGRL